MGEGDVQVGLAARRAYAASGVDVDAGERAVDLMKARVAATHGPEVLAGLGGFGAAVSLPTGFREPVLVSATDGVGTKTAIAAALGRHDTIGIDLVAMCADDVVCLGARPLFFLDYVAVGCVVPETIADLVGGVARGCEIAGCSLVGGETAEHPGLMRDGDFDLAGFCVGVAERVDLLDGTTARAGDALIGMASTGLHANGFSLVRALLSEHRLELTQPYLEVFSAAVGRPSGAERAEPQAALRTLGDVLLEPTRIYAPQLLALRAGLARAGHALRGLAHVTGGGLPGNVPRTLPDGLAARIEVGSWPLPSVFRLAARLAGMDGPELRATLNAGIGMVAVVPDGAAHRALEILSGLGLQAWRIGSVVTTAEAGGRRYVEVDGGRA
jgi:phosphoribosylformylglycinamidine cyclo-ligase